MPASLRSMKNGKTEQVIEKTEEIKRAKRKRPAKTVELAVEETNEMDIIMISHEQGNQEMLQLAAEAEAMVPAHERNTEWPIKVMGRLGLTGSKSGKTYDVSRAELQRRTGQPEHLSGSAVCQYLKRRRQAAELPRDIHIPKAKTKSCSSLFTLLTEGEARELARDFGDITRQEKFFDRLGQYIEDEKKQAVRDSCIQLLEALDGIEPEQCRASLRQHGFLIPAVREVFKQLYDGIL